MNDYIIIALLVILIVIIIFKNKKNDNQDSYDPLKHEGYNKDIKEDIKTDISTKIENLRTAITTSVGTVGTNVGVNKGIIESKSGEILEAHRRLVESISGSKKSGIAGELLLENFFRSSGSPWRSGKLAPFCALYTEWVYSTPHYTVGSVGGCG